MYNLSIIEQLYLYKCILIHTVEVNMTKKNCDLHVKVKFIHSFSVNSETSLLIIPLRCRHFFA